MGCQRETNFTTGHSTPSLESRPRLTQAQQDMMDEVIADHVRQECRAEILGLLVGTLQSMLLNLYRTAWPFDLRQVQIGNVKIYKITTMDPRIHEFDTSERLLASSYEHGEKLYQLFFDFANDHNARFVLTYPDDSELAVI